jgi:hypothetical protein
MQEYNFYLQHGGGLGDFYNYLYHYENYHELNKLKDGEKALVLLQAHNPSTEELFTLHPKSPQIDFINFGYHGSWEAALDAFNDAKVGKIRTTLEYQGNLLEVANKYDFDTVKNGLEKALATPVYKRKSFILPLFDNEFQYALDNPYIVFNSVSGESKRDIPEELEAELIDALLERNIGVAILGKNYVRFERKERDYSKWESRPQFQNFVDKLNVFQTISIVRGAIGAICSHSAISLVSWHERVPQMLLYGKWSETHRFVPYKAGDISLAQWCFGAYLPYNMTLPFWNIEVVKKGYLDEFLRICKTKIVYTL